MLRLGRFHAMRGPGLFLIVPIIDSIPYWIDIRVITSSFSAERTLTNDTVPVNVDAVLFWKVVDPKKAALDVADYHNAISWAAQTALRDVIGKTILSDMLEGREKISEELQRIIDLRTEPWGISVISVEVKDMLIPPALEDAMSMQAQAERERQTRVILGRFGAADRAEIRRSRCHLCQQSDRVSFACNEVSDASCCALPTTRRPILFLPIRTAVKRIGLGFRAAGPLNECRSDLRRN